MRKSLNKKGFKEIFPNVLTVSRIFLSPVIFFLLSFLEVGWTLWFLLALSLIACFSDTFDGILARRWGVESDFGKKWDPRADKVYTFIMYTGIILFVELGSLCIPMIFIFVIMIWRDVRVDLMRKGRKARSSINSARAKTIFQMILINFIVLYHVLVGLEIEFWNWFYIIAGVLSIVTLCLSLFSWYKYHKIYGLSGERDNDIIKNSKKEVVEEVKELV